MYNGIINIYKEKGFTSFDVVAKLRGIFHQKKIGHTGTLDPDAEGVLPVCLGNATKVCDLLTDQDKEYEAVMLLGVTTDTQDISGTVLQESPVETDEETVEKAIMSFVGPYEQVPPMYSARKVNGKKLYELARAGITVERKAKEVQIYDINILDMDLPRVRMRVRCSKGTYIRTLCNDIGEKLGCGGCMEELLRTKVGNFNLKDALKIAQVEAVLKNAVTDEEIKENVNKLLHNVDTLFTDYKALAADVNLTKAVVNGNKISIQEPALSFREPNLPCNFLKTDCPDNKVSDGTGREIDLKDGEWVRLYLEDDVKAEGARFLGIYSYQESLHMLKPVKLFL